MRATSLVISMADKKQSRVRNRDRDLTCRARAESRGRPPQTPPPRQAGHRRHQAEQDAKGAKIDILKIRRRRGRKARGNQREERRDQEHRLPFHKTKQPLFQPAFTGSFGLQTSIQPWEFDSFSSSSQVRRMAELALPQAG